jgi:hypothetical protein
MLLYQMEGEIKMAKKKVLQIKKGEYLLEIRNNAVATTYSLDSALDISSWKLEQLGFIVGNLKNVGYKNCTVLTIANEDEQESEGVVEDEQE